MSSFFKQNNKLLFNLEKYIFYISGTDDDDYVGDEDPFK